MYILQIKFLLSCLFLFSTGKCSGKSAGKSTGKMRKFFEKYIICGSNVNDVELIAMGNDTQQKTFNITNHLGGDESEEEKLKNENLYNAIKELYDAVRYKENDISNENRVDKGTNRVEDSKDKNGHKHIVDNNKTHITEFKHIYNKQYYNKNIKDEHKILVELIGMLTEFRNNFANKNAKRMYVYNTIIIYLKSITYNLIQEFIFINEIENEIKKNNGNSDVDINDHSNNNTATGSSKNIANESVSIGNPIKNDSDKNEMPESITDQKQTCCDGELQSFNDETVLRKFVYEKLDKLLAVVDEKNKKLYQIPSKIYEYVYDLVKTNSKHKKFKLNNLKPKKPKDKIPIYKYVNIKNDVMDSYNKKQKPTVSDENQEKCDLNETSDLFYSLFIECGNENFIIDKKNFDLQKLSDFVKKIQNIHKIEDFLLENNSIYKYIHNFFVRHECRKMNDTHIQNYTAALVFCTPLFQILNVLCNQQIQLINNVNAGVNCIKILQIYQKLIYNLYYEILYLFNKFVTYNENDFDFVETIWINTNIIIRYDMLIGDNILLEEELANSLKNSCDSIYNTDTVYHFCGFVRLYTLKGAEGKDYTIENVDEKNKYVKQYLYMICFDNYKNYECKDKNLKLKVQNLREKYKIYRDMITSKQKQAK